MPQGKYQDVVKKLRPAAAAPGEIVDTGGRVLGEHEGIINYTVGQRRGLGVATGQPLFVVKLDAGKRRVIVGPREALGVSRMTLKEMNWLGEDGVDGREILVRVRSTRPPVEGKLYINPLPNGEGAGGGGAQKEPLPAPSGHLLHAPSPHPPPKGGGGVWSIELESPEEGVAPGQAAVFYDRHTTRVLGGAWIAATER